MVTPCPCRLLQCFSIWNSECRSRATAVLRSRPQETLLVVGQAHLCVMSVL